MNKAILWLEIKRLRVIRILLFIFFICGNYIFTTDLVALNYVCVFKKKKETIKIVYVFFGTLAKKKWENLKSLFIM